MEITWLTMAKHFNERLQLQCEGHFKKKLAEWKIVKEISFENGVQLVCFDDILLLVRDWKRNSDNKRIYRRKMNASRM